MPPDLDPEDPENWHWSNPSPRLHCDPRTARIRPGAGAQSDPESLRDFRYSELNVKPEDTAGEGRWLPLEVWDAAADDMLTLPALLRDLVRIAIGTDAGGLDDLAAVTAIGETADGRFLVWSEQWVSRQGYDKRKSVNDYDAYIDAGELTVFDGGGGDIEGIAEVVSAAAATGKLQIIGIDSYGASDVEAGAEGARRRDRCRTAELAADTGDHLGGAPPHGWRVAPLRLVAAPVECGKCRRSSAAATRSRSAKGTVVGARKIDGLAATPDGRGGLPRRSGAAGRHGDDRMKPDALSGWATAPAAARLAGDWPAFRYFETAEEAMRFIAVPARNAERQRRHRQRQRARAVALTLTVPDACVSALIEAGRLERRGLVGQEPSRRGCCRGYFRVVEGLGKHFP